MASYSGYAYHLQQHVVERLPSGIFFRADQLQHGPDLTEVYEKGIDLLHFPIFRREDNGYSAPSQSGGQSAGDLRCAPLLNVNIDADVQSTLAKILVTQTFTNHSSASIKEAHYSFPLYDGSAIISFRCYIGNDKVLDGVVKPKDTARKEFNEAMAKQKVAAMLEEHTPEVFETRLGNIPAKTTVKVEIAYVHEVKADIGGEGILLTIPSSVAPRYGTPPERYAPSLDTSPNGLHINVNVTAAVSIRKLESRTHPISVEMGTAGPPAPVASFGDLASAEDADAFNPRKARATLAEQTVVLHKDFVLLIIAAGSSMLASRALLETAPGLESQSAMMLSLNPKSLFSSYAEPEAFQGEIIFIADRSGSMTGPKMEILRSALQVFLKSIPSENAYFNIYSFGSSYTSLWPKSHKYNQKNLDVAINHVLRFEADMGGTELHQPIKQAVHKRLVKPNFSTQIIVLTDGEVWNAEHTTDFIRSTRADSADDVRFFALGIGDQVSHRLVEGIGQLGGGFAEVVAVDSQGRWEERVIRTLKGALMPASFSCELEFNGMSTTEACSHAKDSTFLQAPYKITSLHPFTRFSVYFLVDKKFANGLDAVTVKTTTTTGSKIVAHVPIEQIGHSAFTVHYLAAKSLIRDLESGSSWIHASSKSKSASVDSIASEVGERLGVQYQVTSKWTTFVAVEKTKTVENMVRMYRAPRDELTMLSQNRIAPTAGSNSQIMIHGLVGHSNHTPSSSARLGSSGWRGLSVRDTLSSHAIIQENRARADGMSDGESIDYDEMSARESIDYEDHQNLLVGRRRSAATGMQHGREVHQEPKKRKRKEFEEEMFEGLPLKKHRREMKDERRQAAGHEQGEKRMRCQRNPLASYKRRRVPKTSPETTSTQAEYARARDLDITTPCASSGGSITLHALIASQAASGSFILNAQQIGELSDLLDSQLIFRDVPALLPNLGSPIHLCYTLMVVMYIKQQYAQDKELWELVVGKAERWVAKQIEDDETTNSIWELARKAWKV